MYDDILFPTDGSEAAADVLPYAMDIATEHDATLQIINVADTSDISLTRIGGDVVDVLEVEGDDIVSAAAKRAEDGGVDVTTAVLQGTPEGEIVRYSNQAGIDCLVIPTHGRSGVKRQLLGSVTERVINEASMPVISVNPGQDNPLTYPARRVLVATDGSRGGDLAVERGATLAAATDATLHLLHVVETASLGLDARSLIKEKEGEQQGKDVIERAAETAREAGVESIETQIDHGRPVREIDASIEEHAIDLAVLGTHGETDFSRYMFGGVSSKIVRSASVPVMWVRDAGSDDGGGD